jgi:hypothetical protein
MARERKPIMGGYGIIGLLVLILDIYCIYLIITGPGDPGMKLLWIIVVLLLPLIGPILYFLLGRGRAA